MNFLQYVAKDILAKHDKERLASVAVVFPNKRASLFLNKYLFEESKKPLWSPAYITISDLFRRHSTLSVPDQISLIFRLYNVYCGITGSSETLDHFFSWGQLMLADFDDIDKNLVDADKLFVNLEAWQEYKDFSFLTEKQRQSLEAFFGSMMQETALQRQFNDTWKHLRQIYHAFRESLQKDGLAYEGMLYRQVVEQGIDNLQYEHYVFVGFNLLQKVEQKLFTQLKEEGKAEFYWDYDNYYMSSQHEAGRYIKQYLERFPNELSEQRIAIDAEMSDIYDNMAKPKDITFVSAPTEDIQARYVTSWLGEILDGDDSNIEANKIAIVLADEHLLQNVIHAIPEKAKNVNVTTGYPLSASPVATLVASLLDLQLYGVSKDRNHFRLQHVNRILRHPLAKFFSTQCRELCESLNDHNTVYPSCEALTEGYEERFGVLFQPLRQDHDSYPLLPWMASVLKFVGLGARNCDDVLMQESIFRMFTLLQRLDAIMTVTTSNLQGVRDGKQLVSTAILTRLLRQLVDSTTIPFHGEPAKGIQVMGVLETRNLDFDHVLLLSANEGNIPRGVDDASFIPHSLRKGFEMTTIENKVAIYSYYFYSLIQRASHATMTYNVSTDDGRKGEMSRFMLQLMTENAGNGVSIKTLQSNQAIAKAGGHEVEKSGLVAERLMAMEKVSPTALGKYLRCNLQFYYNNVCGLKELDDNETDEIDNATFGNIFHRTAELIYTHLSGPGHEHAIEKHMIEDLIYKPHALDKFIDQAFREKLFKVDNPSFRPSYNGLQLLNRNVITIYIKRLLRLDMLHTPFRILALEETVNDSLTISVNGQERKVKMGGQVDRLDMVNDPNAKGECLVRVVDYKTGKPLESAPPRINEIFNPEFIVKKHSDYFLQAFLYASIIRRGKPDGALAKTSGLPVAPALLFIRDMGKESYDPILEINTAAEDKRIAQRTRVADIDDVYDDYINGLRSLLQEIFDTNIPFRPTEDKSRCTNCPYKNLCNS